MKNLLILFLAGIFVFSCKSSTKKAVDLSPDDILIKIIQINDVYEIEALSGGKYGGLARVAHIRDSIAEENPNTWYFLAGDFLNPSLLGTIKVGEERLQGKQMVETLNVSGLDLVTFGNHEFDLNEDDLQKRINESEFVWTSANVRQVTAEGFQPFGKETENGKELISEYEIYTASNQQGDTVKVGIFGVTLPSNPKDYVHYDDIFDQAVWAYNELSEKSDFVLGLTHVSLDQDKEIARRLPEVPLIMGGHEHHNMLEQVGNTMIAKADANALSLYVHTLIYNTKSKSLKIESELVMVDERFQSKPEVQEVVDKWTQLLDENLKTLTPEPNEVIYHAVEPLDGTDAGSRSEQTNLGAIITQSMSWVYNDAPDGAITNGGGIRIDDHLAGDLTGKDVFRILPFGGSVLLVEMKGSLLREILDFGLSASGTGAYLQRHNIQRNELGEWLVGDQPLDNDNNYKIAVNDFLMTGMDIPFLTPENPGVIRVETPKNYEVAGDMRKTIIEYMKTLK